MEQYSTKSTGMSLEQLLFAAFNKVKLNVSINGLSSIGS